MQTRTKLTRVLTNKGFFDLEFRRKTEEREIFELTTQRSFCFYSHHLSQSDYNQINRGTDLLDS